MSVIDPAHYLTEAQILQRWPMLSKAELRRARKANPPLIGFYAFHSGPCCTAEQVQEYLDRTYMRVASCPKQPSDSKSETITSTSPIPSAEASGTPAGMTPELARLAAERLAQPISRPPRLRSPRLSPQHPHKAAKGHLALVTS